MDKYYEIEVDSEVIPGQLLVYKKRGSLGKDGCNVCGENIPSIPGETIIINPGKNTFVSKDARGIYSAIYGRVFWDDDVVYVDEVEYLDSLKENRDFKATVVIKEVSLGVKISAGGNIYIHSNISGVQIKSQGNVHIEGDVDMGSQIQAGGKIKINSANNAKLMADGDVIVNGNLKNCQVQCRCLLCFGNRSTIVDSDVYAKVGIWAPIIGSQKTHNTQLRVGRDGSINASCLIYPKTNLKFPQLSLIVQRLTKNVTYKNVKGQIISSSYKQPENIPTILKNNVEDETKYSWIPKSVLLPENSEQMRKLAAELLSIDSYDQITCQMVKDKGQKLRFLFFQKNIEGPWTDRWRKQYGPSKDGEFILENRADGLYLKVTEPQGRGKAVTVEDVFKKIEECKYTDIDKAAVERACKEFINRTQKIGPRQIMREYIKVEIKDNSKAYITISPPRGRGILLTLDDIKKVLKEHGVIAGLNEQNILDSLEKDIFNEPILAAENKNPLPPTSEHDGEIIYKCDENLCAEVIPGQVLAVIKEPKYANGGISIFGEEIPGERGKEAYVEIGRNTYLSYNTVYSNIYGRVRWRGERVDVDEFKQIEGNISGKLEFSGTLKIVGSISKAKVEVLGDLLVDGEVVDSTIVSSGFIECTQDITNSKLTALGISGNSMRNCTVNVGKMISLRGELVNSTIKASRLYLDEQKGLILNCNLHLDDVLVCASLGKEGRTQNSQIKINSPSATIYVSRAIYPKVNITISRAMLIIKKQQRRTKIYLEGGRILCAPYEPPQIKQENKANTIINTAVAKNPLPPSIALRNSETILQEAAKLLKYEVTELEREKINDNVFLVHPKGRGPWNKDARNKYGKTIDGSFEFQNSYDGLYLILCHPTGGGKPIDFERIKQYIVKSGFVNVDIQRIKQAILNKEERVRVGPLQLTEELGGKIIVEVEDDKLSAYIKIIPPRCGEVLVRIEDVEQALMRAGVRFGIDLDKIKEVLNERKFNCRVKVACAKLPEVGQPEYIFYKIKSEGK